MPDFADGVCFLPLAAIREPLLLLPTIAHALGLDERGQQPLPQLLQAFLSEKEMLLVLDNFEQLAAAAPQLTDLFSACSHLKILVTSRERLRLLGEQVFAVSSLAVPSLEPLPAVSDLLSYASMDLLVRRVQASKPGFALTAANAGDLAAICVRLEGLPLALELAAARLSILPPQALLKRLDAPLQILTRGAVDLPEHHQTLRQAIQWSYDLLKAEEQLLFRCLSVFVGGCSLEAIEAVGVAAGYARERVIDGITSLIERSLLKSQEREDGELRLTLLEMLREYGWECLVSSHERETILQAHVAYWPITKRSEPACLNNSSVF